MFYAWINLDSAYPPAEIMLQFYVMQSNGSATWDHRAYWGANNLNYGVNGSISRTNMGALPSAGEWVRLEVPASAVGLEGRIVEGIAFTLWGGRAAWDSAGVLNLDMDGDDWLDTIEIELFDSLLQHGHDDYDNDGLPNYLDSDPLVYDTSPPVFTITSPAEGAVYQ